jgi:hypothetical protein
MSRKRKRGRPPCGHPGCESHSIDALQERLKAPYFTIDEFAELLAGGLATESEADAERVAHTCHECRVAVAERLLQDCHRLHDIDRVEAGLEEVGPWPIFISRPTGDGEWFAVALYSRYQSIPTGLQ